MWVSLASSSYAMELDAMQVNGVNDSIEQPDEQSLHQEISGGYDVFGDPEIFPRVGEEYQVEIPPIISETDYSCFQNNPRPGESTARTLHEFQVGLPIPIIWIKDEGVNDKQRNKGHFLVPGSASETWNEIEEASFILGLYIFGKNLVQVKRFVGYKKMGDVLSFYYGKFHKSNRYQRWSGCRKMKSKKCILGQKIFTGPRQQEFLSRLQRCVSEECRNELLKVSKTFVEGGMHLEDYVFAVRDLVGHKALVEAVGVGKGKEDLTGFAIDSMKPTQSLLVRPEIPAGKACSVLTPSEIVNFLTGDFRLSKARTSDLFWEAVWPRLLARGWHSEQPGSYNYAVAAKHSLVFLVPGVKKFSRKLVKGNHYFDSVTDVLGKVASDPELIELETVADNDCSSKEGNLMDRENSPDHPRHCYLKVKTPTRATDVMEFTVVDTSLASQNLKMVRELRSLPTGVLKASTFETDSDDSDTSEEETNESDSVNTACFKRRKTDISRDSKYKTALVVSSDFSGLENNPLKEELPMSSMGSSSLSASSKNQKTGLLSNTRKRESAKCQFLPGMVSDNKNDLVPVTKRRRKLTTCSRAKQNSSTACIFAVPSVKQEEASLCANNSKSSENITANFFEAPRVQEEKAGYYDNAGFTGNILSPEIPPWENKTLVEPLSKSTSIISRESVPASSSGSKDHDEKPQPRTMIDLNLPVLPEVEADEPSVIKIQQNNTSKESDELSVGAISKARDDSDHQLDANTRRQSRRNRPPTTRVLEAYASGYLDRKDKRRGIEIRTRTL